MKTMGKIIGAVLVLVGIGAVGNQVAHHAPVQAPTQQTPISLPTSSPS